MKKAFTFLTMMAAAVSLSAAPPVNPDACLHRLHSTSSQAPSFAGMKDAKAPANTHLNLSGGKVSKHSRGSAGLFIEKTARRLASRKVSAAPLQAAPLGVILEGGVTYDETWNMSNPTYYRLSTDSPADMEALYSCSEGLSTTGFHANGYVYAPVIEDWGFMIIRNFTKVDVRNRSYEVVNTNFTLDLTMRTATYLPDRNCGLAYGVESALGKHILMSVSLTGNVEKLAETGSLDFDGGLTVDASGKVYGLTASGDLYTISMTDYTCTKIGSTGAATEYPTALCYDDKNGVIYYPTCYETEKSDFYCIDPVTATATKRYIFDTNNEIRVLYIPLPEAADNAPAAPSEMNIDFPGGALSGNISFLPPATTFDGTAATGPISYVVEVDGETAAGGNTSFGAAVVSVPVAVKSVGLHNFRIYCKNANGNGASISTTKYIGPDVPLAAESVVLNYASGTMTLTWDELRGENDGYIDQSKVTYAITRVVNGEKKAMGTVTGTSYTEAYPEPETGIEAVYYIVTASYFGISALPTNSNKVMLGYLLPPYDDNFATAASFENNYIVIDNNGDGRSWLYDSNMQAAYCRDSFDAEIDDWLVLPGLMLEKGKIYHLSYVAGCVYDTYTETSAMYVGRQPKVEALTTEVIAPTSYSTQMRLLEDGTHEGTLLKGSFVPDADGVYYFAIKSCSQLDQYRNFVADIEVSSASAVTAPGPVTDLTLTPDMDGEPIVMVNFTAPKVDLQGKPLASLTKIDIYRDDQFVKSVRPAPGEKVEFEDMGAGIGEVVYQIIPSNEDGDGMMVSGKVFVGLAAPVAPRSVSLENGADYGEVVITWPAVTKDINGLNLQEVSYCVGMFNLDGELITVASNLTETECTYRVCPATAEQAFAQFAVWAVTPEGEGAPRPSGAICVGKPYELPYTESFAYGDDDMLGSILGLQTIAGQGSWSPASDSTFVDINCQDGDNAFMVFFGKAEGDTARLFTGRIAIPEDAKNPELSYYFFCTGADNRNTMDVLVDAGGGFTSIHSQRVGDGTPGDWSRVSVDLSRFKGMDIQIALQGVRVSYSGTLVDNLRVADMKALDLAASVRVAETTMIDVDLPVTAIISNFGTQAIDKYGVELIVDNRVVETKNINATLPSLANNVVSFNYHVPTTVQETIEVCVRAVYGPDGDHSNNMSLVQRVNVMRPDYPGVENLSASIGETGAVELQWAAPDYSDYQRKYTETFETCDPFATMNQGNTNGWTFRDMDGLPTGGLQDLDIPNVPVGEKGSFFVLDGSHKDFNLSFGAHSGSKYLAALYCDGGQNDDWAISPELDGSAQTISFYARGYDTQFDETLQVLYSTTDADPQHFVAVKVIDKVATDAARNWTEYTFDVPEGAKYFAIRYTSNDQFMVLVDDVTFVPADLEPLELIGFNVYRDGVKLNDKPLTDTMFTDSEDVPGAAYVVTAVYNAGESAASQIMYPRGNSVESIQGVTVKGLTGAIEVSGATDAVSVIDMQGRVLYSGGCGLIPAERGAYIVRIGRRSVKVLVK